MTKPKQRLVWRQPARLIATGCGVGRLPWMPGTWASVAALFCGWAIRSEGGITGLAAATMVAFGVGWWASARVAQASGEHDPGIIVIDEVTAQWLVLLAAPLDWRWYAAALALFRLFDIAKPWPIRTLEQSLPGGLGIMLDDVAAALYALALLLIGQEIFDV